MVFGWRAIAWSGRPLLPTEEPDEVGHKTVEIGLLIGAAQGFKLLKMRKINPGNAPLIVGNLLNQQVGLHRVGACGRKQVIIRLKEPNRFFVQPDCLLVMLTNHVQILPLLRFIQAETFNDDSGRATTGRAAFGRAAFGWVPCGATRLLFGKWPSEFYRHKPDGDQIQQE